MDGAVTNLYWSLRSKLLRYKIHMDVDFVPSLEKRRITAF